MDAQTRQTMAGLPARFAASTQALADSLWEFRREWHRATIRDYERRAVAGDTRIARRLAAHRIGGCTDGC